MFKLDLKRARNIQENLINHLITYDDLILPPKYVVGLDISYRKSKAVACCVILDYYSLEIVEIRYVIENVEIPYIPTFLAYRELPFYVHLCYEFKNRKDMVFLVDGHGLAHPRKMGIASHLGVVLNIPTIGVAKKILTGKPVKLFNKEYLVLNDGTIAAIIIKHDAYSPIFISLGNKISLETSEKIVLHTLKKHRLPEPIYLAHTFSKKEVGRI